MKEMLNSILEKKAANVKFFFCDVDGTLTDGGVYYSPRGEELKKFSLRDGTGFFLLKQCGIRTGFITTENSPIVEQRVKKLNVDAYIFGTNNKSKSLEIFLSEVGLTFDDIAFIGDELNDVNLLKQCGLSFAVGDADDSVKAVVDVVCKNKGGQGAFREAVGDLLKLRHIDIEEIIDKNL